MKQNADRGDSEAQASNFNVNACPRCHAPVTPGTSECASCGTPVVGLTLVEHLEPDVQPQLARANLERLRGHYEEAERTCLDILKRLPQHFEAHVLLGDVFADQQKHEQAAQWYELALELNPNSFLAKQRLQVAADQMRRREAAAAADQLGLPPPSGARALALGSVALLAIGLCGFLAYNLGQSNPRAQGSEVLNVPISATPDAAARFDSGPQPQETPTSREPTRLTPSLPAPKEDRDLLEQLAKGPWGQRLLSALQDPRTKHVTLTAPVNTGEQERRVAAEVAREALATLPEALVVTVRIVRDGQLAYVADVPRARVAETQTEPWQQASANPDAWVPYVLTNEWVGIAPATPPTTAGDAKTP